MRSCAEGWLRSLAAGAAQHRLPQRFSVEVSRLLTALLCCLFSLEYIELSALIVSNSIFSKSRTPPRTRLTPRGSRSAPSSPRGAWKALKPVKTSEAADRFTNTERLNRALWPREARDAQHCPGRGDIFYCLTFPARPRCPIRGTLGQPGSRASRGHTRDASRRVRPRREPLGGTAGAKLRPSPAPPPGRLRLPSRDYRGAG